MTPPLLTLLLAAGDDLEAAARTVEAAHLVRPAGARWDVVVVTGAPLGTGRRWVHEVVAEGSVTEQLAHALAAARGTWVAVLGPDDRLEPGGVDALLALLALRPELDVAYTDEQWPGAGADGMFTKPRWVPEYERGTDYLGRLCAVRRDLLTRVGGFAPESEGAVEWDAHLRVVEHTDRIEHVSVVGLTRSAAPEVTDDEWEAGLRAVARHFARAGQDVTVERGPRPGSVRTWRAVPEPPLVSVVVPTGGGRRTVRGEDTLLAEMCARSLVDGTAYERWELVLVPSEGTDPAVAGAVADIVGDRLVVAPATGPFNFARSINVGVAAARGDLVLLLNDDVEAIDPRWLDRMVSVLQDRSIGVVGPLLLDEGEVIQHVGVIYTDGWEPGHLFIKEPDGHEHFGVGVLDADFTATTGACLLMSRRLFTEVGGMTEELPLNYNDVDLCHKVVREGLRVVVTPAARLHHYESSSRVPVIREDETAYLRRYWSWLAWRDPWVNTRASG
jgi:GT2 family glycosyltransferase